MGKRIVIIILGFLVSNCSNDVNFDNQLVGHWKLIRAEQHGHNSNGGFELFNINYSDKNIVFSFSLGEKLTVKGADNIGVSKGEYIYEFGLDCLGSCGDNEPDILFVTIDGSKWVYSTENGIMRLGNSYVDGPDLYFQRIF